MPGWSNVYELPDLEWDIVKFPKSFGRDPNTPSEFGTWMVAAFGRNDYRRSSGTWRYSVSDLWKDGRMYLRVRFRDPKDAMLFKLRWL